jgi:hypothetical protein
MIVACVVLMGLVGCSDKFADFDYNGEVSSKTLRIAEDQIHSVYLYKIHIGDTRSRWYNGDLWNKKSFFMYAPDDFANIGDTVGFTNGVIKVLSKNRG